MAPTSPGTGQIDTLFWIGFVVATILIVAVNVGLFAALRRNRAERGREPAQLTGGRRVQLRVGGALAAFATVLLVVGIVFTEQAREAPATGSSGLDAASERPLRIVATGQQWIWRYDYPNGAFSFYKLVIPADTAIELQLLSSDVVHTWDVPALAGKRDAVPGKTHTVRFSADEEGLYQGHSATLSGQAYGAMRTAVEVVSPQEYKRFIGSEKAKIQQAQDRVVELIEAGDTP